jgi:hypothetical protein
MTQKAASRQPVLFDVYDYQMSLIPSQREQLAALVEAASKLFAEAVITSSKCSISAFQS